MRQADEGKYTTVLLLVDCRTIREFRDALIRVPIRKSSE
jgi:hypothetical protein